MAPQERRPEVAPVEQDERIAGPPRREGPHRCAVRHEETAPRGADAAHLAPGLAGQPAPPLRAPRRCERSPWPALPPPASRVRTSRDRAGVLASPAAPPPALPACSPDRGAVRG